MGGALRAEWRKFVQAPSVQVLLGAVVLLVLALCWQGTSNAASGVSDPRLATPTGASTLALAVYSILLAPIVSALIGARIGAHDLADGVVGTAIVTMGRLRYVLSKLGVLLAAVVLSSAVVAATGAAFGAAVGHGEPEPGALVGLGAPLVFATICALLNALLAFVVGSGIGSVKATVALVVGLFLAPGALPSDLGMTMARLQPYYLVTQFMPNTFEEVGSTPMLRLHAINELGVVRAGLVAIVLVCAYVGAAIVISQRRDVNA